MLLMAGLLAAAKSQEGRLGVWKEASSLMDLKPNRLAMPPTTPTRSPHANYALKEW